MWLGCIDTNHIDDECEVNEGSDHDIEFFKAGEDAPKAFEPAKQPFDFISTVIDFPVVHPDFTSSYSSIK